MRKTADQIMDLISNSGKKAPEMTHALKYIGDGDMQKGIGKIADYFLKEGTKKGAIRGAAGGATFATVAVTAILFVKKKISESKKHEQEGQEILEGLQNGMAEYEAMEKGSLISREETDTEKIAEEVSKPGKEDN